MFRSYLIFSIEKTLLQICAYEISFSFFATLKHTKSSTSEVKHDVIFLSAGEDEGFLKSSRFGMRVQSKLIFGNLLTPHISDIVQIPSAFGFDGRFL